jgi:hypothetical protein
MRVAVRERKKSRSGEMATKTSGVSVRPVGLAYGTRTTLVLLAVIRDAIATVANSWPELILVVATGLIANT